MSAEPIRRTATPPRRDGSRASRHVMRAGLVLALLLLAAGTLTEVAIGGQANAVGYAGLLSDPSVGDRVLMVGVLVLALTPVAQVLALAFSWLRLGDIRYAAVAVAVMALLVVGALLGVAR